MSEAPDLCHVTEVWVRPPGPDDGRQLLAMADVVIGGVLKIHDLRVVLMDDGRRLVAMPRRPLSDPCERCGRPAPRTGRYCPHCAAEKVNRPSYKHWADVVHPISAKFRSSVERAVLDELDRKHWARPEGGRS